MEEKKQPTLVEQVKAWLYDSEQDYSEGLTLLSKASKNRILHGRLSRKEFPAKLKYELEKFYLANTNQKALGTLKKMDPENTDVNPENQDDDPENQDDDPENTNAATDEKTGTTTGADVDAAKQEAEGIVNDATEEAEQTKAEAEESAEEIVNEAQEQADKILNKAEEVYKRKIVSGESVPYEKLPDPLKLKFDENVKSYKLLRGLHAKLKVMANATDDERKPVCEEMVQLDELIRKNWDAIDAWDGKPIAEETAKEITGKDVNNARSYISRNKERLAEGHPDREKYFDKVQERVTLVLNAGEEFEEDSIAELKAYGITFGK